MNNANFRIDCRNNIDNCQFETMYDEIDKTVYIKKYANIYGNKQYKGFACPETMKKEIEATFKKKLLALDPNHSTFKARKYSINRPRIENLNAVNSMIAEKKKKKKMEKTHLFLTLNKRSKTA